MGTKNQVLQVIQMIQVMQASPVSPVSPLSPVSPVSLAHLWVLFGVIFTLAKFQVFILKSPQIETELNADSNNAG